MLIDWHSELNERVELFRGSGLWECCYCEIRVAVIGDVVMREVDFPKLGFGRMRRINRGSGALA